MDVFSLFFMAQLWYPLPLAMSMSKTTNYGYPVRKSPSLHGQKSTHTPKFMGTAEAYFVSHIGPNIQISLIYAFIDVRSPWVKPLHELDAQTGKDFSLENSAPVWIAICILEGPLIGS